MLKAFYRSFSGVTALAFTPSRHTNLRSWQVRATGSVKVTSSCLKKGKDAGRSLENDEKMGETDPLTIFNILIN